MKHSLLTSLCVLTIAAGCGPKDDPYDPSNEHEWTKQAREQIPTAMALHSQVIQRSCTPTEGVCHNNKEYPDLHTVGNLITAAGKDCNLDEEDPSQIYDGCEPQADQLYIESLDFVSDIAQYGPEEYDPQTGTGYRDIVLADPVPANLVTSAAEFRRDGARLFEVPSNLNTTAGSTDVRLVNIYYLEYPIYQQTWYVRAGDPNGNGILGAELGWAEVVRGAPERSYLVARVLGSVPGTRMPLANQPISNAEYVALICWIETLDSNPLPEQRINYDACKYAKDPQDYELK